MAPSCPSPHRLLPPLVQLPRHLLRLLPRHRVLRHPHPHPHPHQHPHPHPHPHPLLLPHLLRHPLLQLPPHLALPHPPPLPWLPPR